MTAVWAKDCKKVLIDRDMTELSKKLGYSRTYLSSVINGRLKNDPCKESICNYLGISF